MVRCVAALDDMASHYAGYGNYLGVATGDPGTGADPSATEASGGSPAYVRVAGTWTAGSTGVQATSGVSLNVQPATYDYLILASAATGITMTDNCAITPIIVSAQGVIVVAAVYTQT